MIERRAYLDARWRWKDKQVIKVITGIRRCGKSTLMALYQQELVERGMAREQILSVNLEDYANYALRDPHKLHAHVLAQAEKVQGKLYVFLDEIQNVQAVSYTHRDVYKRQISPGTHITSTCPMLIRAMRSRWSASCPHG